MQIRIPNVLYQLTLLRMEGFLVFDYMNEFPRALADLSRWLAEGKIKRRETIVSGGLEQAPRALAQQLEGANIGMSSLRPIRIFPILVVGIPRYSVLTYCPTAVGRRLTGKMLVEVKPLDS